MVENAGPLRAVRLEGADALVGLFAQLGPVIFRTHQVRAVVGRNVEPFGLHDVVDLLAEIERPVERRRVVVDQLRIRMGGTDAIHHPGDLFDMRLFRLDPQQVRTILKRCDAIEHAPVLAGSGAELEQVRSQPLRPHQLSVAGDDDIAIADLAGVNLFAVEEAVILVANVSRSVADGNLLRETGAERVGARDDDPVLDPQFKKGVTAGADLG